MEPDHWIDGYSYWGKQSSDKQPSLLGLIGKNHG